MLLHAQELRKKQVPNKSITAKTTGLSKKYYKEAFQKLEYSKKIIFQVINLLMEGLVLITIA